ncbi:DEAD/DEAH box helicase [Pedobacter yonginense]|uniref:DEAD/DEAH box helicase n=1 Tax=Pedobacter yonginense TaxID=651869 RepID=UPI00197FCDAA|nr:DEAD/DEAH box helicase [Pedobacter yonginense]
MDIFQTCHLINENLQQQNEVEARNNLIQLLDYHKSNEIPYSPLVNSLIRQTGLFPYLQLQSCNWQDRFAHEAFKVRVSETEEKTLHREQSLLLKKLVDGESLAVSAPTSFGKSFVIDSFISIKKPRKVVILVPTIALTDETRRRLYKKFANSYKIITTTEVGFNEDDYCIFVFPQERAISYISKINEIDILVIDEFYKASSKYDKERSPSLIKAIIKLGKVAKQKYFLAPNITTIKDNIFTKDMEFLSMLDFHTVYLEKHELYKEINGDEILKSEKLLDIVRGSEAKSLIYAASYTQIEKVGLLFIERLPHLDLKLLNEFGQWLIENYDTNWQLVNLIIRGVGIHNGRMHRSLSQIQVKLFEEVSGITNMISTSSIIEGVNTSAENVIIWRNRKGGRGNAYLDDFTYKNIIGRGGRMFKHFVGKIFLLEAPPADDTTQLSIDFPDDILGDIDETIYQDSLNTEQIDKIITFKKEMAALLGEDCFKRLLKDGAFQQSSYEFIRQIARDMKNNPNEWKGFSFLNSEDTNNWDHYLYKVLRLIPGNWEVEYSKFVSFIKILSNNWTKSIPQLLEEL